jgi:hypothetical protein
MDVKAVTWEKYDEKRGIPYNPQKSGVVEADKRAEKFFKTEAEHAKIQAEYDKMAKEYEAMKTERWAALAKNRGKVSGVVEADRRAEKFFEQQAKQVKKAKIFNWKKAGKWGLIGLGITTVVGLIANGIKKNNDNQETVLSNRELNSQEANQELISDTVSTANQKETEEATPSTSVVSENSTVSVESTESDSIIDADNNITVEAGDGLWHIARRYLEDKYKNEPEEFENLSTDEQEKLVWKEVKRIAELNNFELVTTVLNGKEVIVTAPMIHPGDKVKVV